MAKASKEELYTALTGTSFSSVSKLRASEDTHRLKFSFKEIADIPKLQQLTDELYKATALDIANNPFEIEEV